MKEIMLKKDMQTYLQREIIHIRKSNAAHLTDVKEPSFVHGYKAGQLAALEKALNYLNFGIGMREL
ncbi:MAG: hypothetical protein ACI4A5_08900 [Hominilimicola sp.]